MKNFIKKILAWSYSRYNTYKTCPRKAKYSIIDRLQEPENDAMRRGTRLHKTAEDYLTGRLKKLTPEFDLFVEEYKLLKQQGPRCEENWAFTRAWGECDWFAKETWVRVKIDAFYFEGKDQSTIVIVDHKSGKPYEDHEEQLILYAVGAIKKFPQVKTIIAEMWYIDTGDVGSVELTRAEAEQQLKAWEKRVVPMLNDETFATKPSRSCGYCHYRKSNGGPCEF